MGGYLGLGFALGLWSLLIKGIGILEEWEGGVWCSKRVIDGQKRVVPRC